MVSPRFTFLEFFAGGGMARLGLAEHFDCIFANDHDAKKCKAYRQNFGAEHLVEADIDDLHAGQVPTADLAWASFPCQDLSLAGSRSGMSGARSGTFWSFWKLMTDLGRERRAPKVIVIENVTGLLTSHQGRDFEALVMALGSEGYVVGGGVIDAANFVPQSRPRLFLIAWQNSMQDPALAGNEADPFLSRATHKLPYEAERYWRALKLPSAPHRNTDLAAIIDKRPPASVWRSCGDLEKLLSQMAPLHRARVDAAVAAGCLKVGAVYRRIRKGVQRAEVRYDGLAGCVRTLKGGSSRQLLLISERGELRLRPMLARESADLMGLPSTYALPNTATAAISLCGDGVCVPAVAWLSRHVLAPLLQQNLVIGPGDNRVGAY